MTDLPESPLRILLHAPTPDAFARAQRNLANIRTEAPHAQVELVVNAAAVRVAAERSKGLNPYLRFCANSLRASGLATPSDAVVVPNAMLHIAQRQREGWAYIRT